MTPRHVHPDSDLHDAAAAAAFYEERYAHGYMDSWPREGRRRRADRQGSEMYPFFRRRRR